MTFTPPEKVLSPKSRLKLKAVVFAGPPDGMRGFSVACVEWLDENNNWMARLAVRWNANPDRPYGNPNSRQVPTWFILPDDLAPGVAREAIKLIEDKGDRSTLKRWLREEMKRGDLDEK